MPSVDLAVWQFVLVHEHAAPLTIWTSPPTSSASVSFRASAEIGVLGVIEFSVS
jgi:hypothetical protein